MERKETEARTSVVRNHFLGYLLGVFLRYSSYCAILNLQSSINIEDGLEFYTLIPAAILVGAGEATIWSSMTLINFYFATKYATLKKHKYKENEYFVNLYSGYFFTCIQFCQIFGNLVVYAVLYAFVDSESNNTQNTGNNFTTTQSYSESDNLMFCGSNDCQDSTAVDESLNQYVPTKNVSLTILITILTFMCFTSLICHWYFISEDVTVVVISKVTDKDISKTSEKHVNLAFEVHPDEIHQDTSERKKDDVNIGDNKTCPSVTKSNSNSCFKDINKEEIFPEVFCDKIQSLENPNPARYETEETFGGAYLRSLKDLGKHTVGIHMATYGFSDAVLSYVVGKVGRKIGRISLFVFSMVVDFGSYAYCLWWDPNLESAWSIFIIYFALGATDGIWQTLTNVLYLEYFEEGHDVAITSWVLWSFLGYSLQFGWSTKLCVYVKIYIQVGMLILGMICYGVAEYLHQNEKLTEVAEEETRL
uniref:protein unc-93 homolog A-like n=1 Tax=Styela clava TaxID=7725 RepID=UPI00193A7275|nr:protein unc-93 homolog A-like [Styela clava]